MAGLIGRLIAFFTRAEPREAPPTGWALALDAVIAVTAAAGAVYEMAERSVGAVVVPAPVIVPPGIPFENVLGMQGRIAITAAGTVHPSTLMLAAAALTALPLAARRLYPIGTWLAIAAAIVAAHQVFVPPVALGTALYAAYSAITYSRYLYLAIAVVSVVTVAVAGTLGDELPRFPGRLTAVFAILPAVGAGLGFRVLRRRLADSTARLHRAADDAKAATERALTAERARIASELHDVVTHNVSVMIVQAGAARKILASSQADAEDALLAVEATGREAMTELRNLLGLLSPAGDGTDDIGRSPASPAGAAPGAGASGAGLLRPGLSGLAPGPRPGPVPAALRPQPGLSELDSLIRRVSAAGLPVELAVSGVPRTLSPGADLAAYRVVQEGLTNVLRHAGTATATVGVNWSDSLEITVGDDGHGAVGRAEPGRGLLGLRERLALYGGELTAGPRPGAGWRVRAVLPLREVAG